MREKKKHYLCTYLPLDQLDDEIATSVYQSRGLIQDVDSITELTPENFHDAVAQRSLTVVLFYFQCEMRFFFVACQSENMMTCITWMAVVVFTFATRGRRFVIFLQILH